MDIAWWLLGLLALFVFAAWRTSRRMGPPTLPPSALTGARAVVRVTRDAPGEGWVGLGACTEARGLDLRFEHPDDPQAEATLLVPGMDLRASQLGRGITVRLGSDFAEHHVHNGGWVFRVRMRGTGVVVGKEVRIKMFTSRGRPYGGRIENDDDTDPAVGGWIEVEWAEVLEVARPE